MDRQPGQKETQKEKETYARLAGVRGVPEIIKTGKHDNKHYITMQLLGKSVLDVMNEGVITEKDALLIAVKAINILRDITKEASSIETLSLRTLCSGKATMLIIYI